MSIYDVNLFGKSKHGMAVERIREFCAGKKTLVAFSGGKDSQCIYHLAEEAGVQFNAQYSVTRFEPPELIKFIYAHYPTVTFRRVYKKPLITEIESNGLPNRWARWCCACKHVKTEGYNIAVIGIRWQESAARRDSWRIFGYKPDHTAYVCPIADWTTEDVWEYLEGRPHCSLYDEGFKRIGCVCCPLAGNMEADARRWPKTAAMLRQGADRYVQRFRKSGWVKANGKPCSSWCKAHNPEDEYFNRWIKNGQTAQPTGIDYAAGEPCLFDGTGFSGYDGNMEDSEQNGDTAQ